MSNECIISLKASFDIGFKMRVVRKERLDNVYQQLGQEVNVNFFGGRYFDLNTQAVNQVG